MSKPRHVAVPFTTGQYKSEVDGYCERTQFPIALEYAVTFFMSGYDIK